MTSALGFLLLATLIGSVARRLQANHLHNSQGPRVPAGSDPRADRDLARLRHDLAISPRSAAVRPTVARAARPQGACRAQCAPSTS